MNLNKKLFTGLFTAGKIFLSLLVLVVSSTSVLRAADISWDGTGTGGNLHLWDRQQNWVGTAVPGVNDIARFGLLGGTDSVTPLVNTAAAISNIVFNLGASGYTFGGSAVLTVGAGGIVNNGLTAQTINTALALANAQTLNANAGNLVFGGTVDVAGIPVTIAGAANTTFGGIVSGSGSLIKTGTGVLTLSAANTITGGLTINGGTVSVNNGTGSATGTGNVTVNSGTFRGNGTITGGLTLNSGSRISPGNANGAQRVSTIRTGNQTWNGGAAMTWEIKDATSTAGTGWDLISITGALDLSALNSGNQFTIDLTSLAGNSPGDTANFDSNSTYTWTILTTTGGITGFQESAFNLTTTGFSNPLLGTSQFIIGLVDGGNSLAITYVPEPSTIALGILGAAVIAGHTFRRRNKK